MDQWLEVWKVCSRYAPGRRVPGMPNHSGTVKVHSCQTLNLDEAIESSNMHSGEGDVSWSLPRSSSSGPIGTHNPQSYPTSSPPMPPGQGQVLMSAPACSPGPPEGRRLPPLLIVLFSWPGGALTQNQTLSLTQFLTQRRGQRQVKK